MGVGVWEWENGGEQNGDFGAPPLRPLVRTRRSGRAGDKSKCSFTSFLTHRQVGRILIGTDP